MPTRIREHNNKIIDRYYEQMNLKDSIEYARALIARLNNGDYQGLTSESASDDTVNIEKESKDDEVTRELNTDNVQDMALFSIFGIPPGLDPRKSKFKYGAKIEY